MKICFACGAQNLDNSKFCCQCGKSIDQDEGEKRVFVPMCEDSSPSLKMQSLSKANFDESAGNSSDKKDDAYKDFSFNKNSTKSEEDDAYADFKMRDRDDIFNDAESGVFSNSSYDRHAEKKRRKDAEKSIKRAEKKKKKGMTDSDDGWQRDDFWN